MNRNYKQIKCSYCKNEYTICSCCEKKIIRCPSCAKKFKIRLRSPKEDIIKIKPEVLKYLRNRLDSGSDIDNKLVYSRFCQVKESTLRNWIYEVKPPHDRKLITWEIKNLLRRNRFLSNKDIYAKYPNISKRTLLRWIKSIKIDLNII